MQNDVAIETRSRGYFATAELCETIASEMRFALLGIKGESQLVADANGFESVLDMSLFREGIEKDYLNSAILAISSMLPDLQKFLLLKSKRSGTKTIKWYNTLNSSSVETFNLPIIEALSIIKDALKMLGISDTLFDNHIARPGTIDYEERPRKRNGACSDSVYKKNLSFTMLTYRNTLKDFGSLSHELGHAFHHFLLNSEPFIFASASSTVSETVALFVELLCSELLIQRYPETRLNVLEGRLNSCASTFIHVHSRYIFEKELYKAIVRGGAPTASGLSNMMLGAQQKLIPSSDPETFQPYEWATKPHFYYVDKPFYNYPYLIGRLASYEMLALMNIDSDKYAQTVKDALKKSGKNLAQQTLNHLLCQDNSHPWANAQSIIESMTIDYSSLG
jgi:oligoendopeptidase F